MLVTGQLWVPCRLGYADMPGQQNVNALRTSEAFDRGRTSLPGSGARADHRKRRVLLRTARFDLTEALVWPAKADTVEPSPSSSQADPQWSPLFQDRAATHIVVFGRRPFLDRWFGG